MLRSMRIRFWRSPCSPTTPIRIDQTGLQVTSINGEPISPGGRVTLASGASVTMDVAGALAYDPRGHFDYLPRDDTATDGFRYTIADGHGGSSEAVATITIVGRNDDPTAVADTATVAEDGREDETDDGLDNPPPYDIDVLANDDDIDTDDGPRDLRVLAAAGRIRCSGDLLPSLRRRHHLQSRRDAS